MTSRDFDAALRELDQGDPLSFTFGGRDWPIIPVVPAAAVFDLTSVLAGGDIAGSLDAYRRFLDAVIDWPAATRPTVEGEPDDDPHAAFVGALAANDTRVVMEIVKWLVQTIVARPFEPAMPSTG